MGRAPMVKTFFFFQAEDGIRDDLVTGVQTCALPICRVGALPLARRADLRALPLPVHHRRLGTRIAADPSSPERLAPDLPRVRVRRAPRRLAARAMNGLRAVGQLDLFVPLAPELTYESTT